MSDWGFNTVCIFLGVLVLGVFIGCIFWMKKDRDEEEREEREREGEIIRMAGILTSRPPSYTINDTRINEYHV